MTLVQKEVKRITMRPNGSEVQIRPAAASDALYFEAEAANSKITLIKSGSPTAVNIETSTDGNTWSDYTFGITITLSSIGDKLYMRNKSETQTGFSTSTANYYYFSLTQGISAHGSINYLLCKNGTTDLTSSGQYCFCRLFYTASQLLLPPSLPATTLSKRCYVQMFRDCSNMVGIPELPATAMTEYCYQQMFFGCSKIKLSSTQTGNYTQPYRIPTTGTGTTADYWNNNTFMSTGGSFAGSPSINTTFYVHTDNTIVG